MRRLRQRARRALAGRSRENSGFDDARFRLSQPISIERGETLKSTSPRGYSGTPLSQKLGLKSRMRVLATAAPQHFRELLSGAPTDIVWLPRLGAFDCAVAFATTASDLRRTFTRLEPKLARDGMIWIAWPKKASGIEYRAGREHHPSHRARRGFGRCEGVRDRCHVVGAQVRATAARSGEGLSCCPRARLRTIHSSSRGTACSPPGHSDSTTTVIPAKAGIQRLLYERHWIPAFAGMTT